MHPRQPNLWPSLTLILPLAVSIVMSSASHADNRPEAHAPDDVETMTVTAPPFETATSVQTVPASDFELRPLESGGQMLEAIPNVMTAQHTGGGKAEQYFIRGFDADHGTDLAVYFDGVPVNLRSHAHGQGFLDLHFVIPETIERLDATKGPYAARHGDFSTAATIEYVPSIDFSESQLRVSYGEFDTFRAVGVAAPRVGPFADSGPTRGYVAFEAYHTDGPFASDEDLWRYSALARGEVEVSPELVISGHLLGYYAEWDASGLVPEALVDAGDLDRFGSLDPTEGGETRRVQGKLQADWYPVPNGHLSANAYVSWYDFELFSNFTYFLADDTADGGDGIVQRDRDRIYGGGRVVYHHTPELVIPVQLFAGFETRYDDARVLLGNQTERQLSGKISDDSLEIYSLEPYVAADVEPLPWVTARAGVRLAWLHADGRNHVTDRRYEAESATRWLPKLNISAKPFSDEGPLPSQWEGIRDLELFAHFGLGYHSNDVRALLAGGSKDSEALPRATGAETGFRTRIWDCVDVALAGFWLRLEDELAFVGDEGTTESAGRSDRLGVELAATFWLLDDVYLRGDVAYTDARLDNGNDPIAQAPRFVAKAAAGYRHEGFAAELNLRHLGEREATESRSGPRLSDYTVLDFSARYRSGPIEIGFAVENLANTKWSSSEFYYESRPVQGGDAAEDSHFSPGNPRNVRAWLTGYY